MALNFRASLCHESGAEACCRALAWVVKAANRGLPGCHGASHLQSLDAGQPGKVIGLVSFAHPAGWIWPTGPSSYHQRVLLSQELLSQERSFSFVSRKVSPTLILLFQNRA